jgi:hypothetical protein
MPGFAFKVVRRLVANYERARPYPLRRRVFDYEFRASEEFDPVLLIVTAGSYLKDAAWAAASILTQGKCVQPELSVVFCIDGETDPAEERLLRRSFPTARILRTADVLESIQHTFPRLARFAEAHPMGRKLAALLHFSQLSGVLYSDSDILAFRPLDEVALAIRDRKPAFLAGEGPRYDKKTLLAATRQGLQPAASLNSGFLYSPKGWMNSDLVEKMVPAPEEMDATSPTWWWIEQTILGVLYGGAKSFDPEGYVVSMCRQLPFDRDLDYSQVHLRHFVSSVRHLMYLKGMPLVFRHQANGWKKWNR